MGYWKIILNAMGIWPSHTFIFFNVYLFILREREKVEERQRKRRREREGEREFQAGFALSVQSLTWGLISQTVRS